MGELVKNQENQIKRKQHCIITTTNNDDVDNDKNDDNDDNYTNNKCNNCYNDSREITVDTMSVYCSTT